LGNDTLVASTGRDVLVGGLGRDVLAGGTDSLGDVFDFNAKSESLVGANRDLIQNFTRSFDDIDLSGIDARATTTTFNDAFRYAGNVASPYAVWWMTYNGGVLVRADVSGDRVADLEIQVTGTTTLSSIDFIL
jgi:Ca2+-binding RTX toxin-like protein